MDHVHFCDATGKVIVSRLEEGCLDACVNATDVQCGKCITHVSIGARRRGKLTVRSGSVFFCTADADMLKSKRVFLRTLELYAAMIDGLVAIQQAAIEEVRNESRRLVHNLTTLNSHIIQEIYNLVPQDDLAGAPNRQISIISGVVKNKPNLAAQAALKILKNAVAARTEMQVVRRFRSAPQLPMQRRSHMIHKVVKNVLITFFQESQERDLYWNLRSCDERVLIDYESISAALYRLFENFIKYCAPRSTIDIAFEAEVEIIRVVIEMRSLPILSGEEEKIFEDGFSGAMAQKHGLSGSGLGMPIVRQMLRMNDADIRVEAGTRIEVVSGIEYAPNRFVISLPRAAGVERAG